MIQTAPDFKGFPENEWDEKILAIGGEVKIKITGPCGRCVMTTLPQGDLPKDTGILKTAASTIRRASVPMPPCCKAASSTRVIRCVGIQLIQSKFTICTNSNLFFLTKSRQRRLALFCFLNKNHWKTGVI